MDGSWRCRLCRWKERTPVSHSTLKHVDPLRAEAPTEEPAPANRPRVDLSTFDNSWYDPGRGRAVRAIWYGVNLLVFASSVVPFSGPKRWLLRLFGAKVGRDVVIKPRVNIKYPWRVEIGDNAWIGEGVWLDSLTTIRIGSHCCISQGAYLCTGSHDWHSSSFDLIVKPITLEQGVWICCRALVLGGVTLADHSILAAGSTLTHDTQPYTVYRGNPAEPIRLTPAAEDAGAITEPASGQTGSAPAQNPAGQT